MYKAPFFESLALTSNVLYKNSKEIYIHTYIGIIVHRIGWDDMRASLDKQ